MKELKEKEGFLTEYCRRRLSNPQQLFDGTEYPMNMDLRKI